MKTFRVVVLLLLASVHVFTPASSDAPGPTGPKQPGQPTPTAAAASAASVSHAPVTTSTAPTMAPTPAPTTAQKPTTARQDVTSKAAASTKAADASPPPAVTSPSPRKHTSTLRSRTTAAPVTPTDAVTTSERQNDTVHPRGIDVTNVANSTDDKKTHAPAAVSTHPPKPSKGTSVVTTVAPQLKTNAAEEKGAGSQTGGDSRTPPQSDKRLWWILLPVLLVGAAAAIVLRFKCKKVHDHIETIDTGTENASFQSRPESTKDGVMLLGVKSSGGDDSAAAR